MNNKKRLGVKMFNDTITAYILIGIGVYLNADAFLSGFGSVTFNNVSLSIYGLLFIALAFGILNGKQSSRKWAVILCAFPTVFGLIYLMGGCVGIKFSYSFSDGTSYNSALPSFYIYNAMIVLIYGLPMYSLILNKKHTQGQLQ
jgi:hypothetical protein